MVLSLVLVLFLASYVKSCPKMCSCSLDVTTCYFTKCSDPLPVTETYVLHIHGSVCTRQREILENAAFWNTIKWFYDDLCYNVPYCRQILSLYLCVVRVVSVVVDLKVGKVKTPIQLDTLSINVYRYMFA